MSFVPLRALLPATVALATAAGCASAPSDPTSTTSEEAALSAATWSYVMVRRDQRKCASPMCGGWFVRDVGRDAPEKYVSAIDYGPARLDDEETAQLSGAADGELLLLARLGPREWRHHTRTLLASAAWRGMPGRPVADGDAFYAVSRVFCIRAPCTPLLARELNGDAGARFSGVDVAGAAIPYADTTWMTSSVVEDGALVAGHFEPGAGDTPDDRILAASQVFVRVADLPACPATTQTCTEGRRMTYTRDADRCLVATGCVLPGICPLYRPYCPAGYTLEWWPSGSAACAAWACDPTFVAR